MYICKFLSRGIFKDKHNLNTRVSASRHYYIYHGKMDNNISLNNDKVNIEMKELKRKTPILPPPIRKINHCELNGIFYIHTL